MIGPRRASSHRLRRGSRALGWLGASLAAFVVSCSDAQDLGYDDAGSVADDDAAVVVRAPETPTRACDDGFGASWSCGDEAVARDYACPVGRPIDGSACTADDRAPCVYLDGREPPPDVDVPGFVLPDRSERPTSLCLCGRDGRWSCLAGITFRTLAAAVVDGDACVDPVEVRRPCSGDECAARCGAGACDLVCRCVAGRYVCGRA